LRPPLQQPATQRTTKRNPRPAQPPTQRAIVRNPTERNPAEPPAELPAEPPAEPPAQLPASTVPAQPAPFAMATATACAPIAGSGIRLVEAYGAGHSLHQQPHKQPSQQPRQRPHERRSYWQLWDGCENASLRTLNADLQERLQAAEEAVKEQQSCDSTKKPEFFLQSSALHLLELMKDLAATATVRPSSATALKEAASTAAPAALRVASLLSPSGKDLAGKSRRPRGLQGRAQASSGTAEQRQRLSVPKNPGMQNQSKTIQAAKKGWHPSQIMQLGRKGPQGSALASSRKARSNSGSNWIRDCGFGAAAGCISACVVAVCMSVL